MRHYGLCILLITMALFCSNTAGAITFQMTDLGTMGGISVFPNDINDRGEIVGKLYTADVYTSPDSYTAFWWHDGVVTRLNPSSSTSEARAINNKSQIVGVIGNNTQMLWQDGIGTQLQYNGRLYDINDMGQIMGCTNRTCITYNGVCTTLVTGGSNAGFCINNLGHVAGYVQDGYVSAAFLWRDGVFTYPYYRGINLEMAVGINDSDQMICPNGLFWENGVTTNLCPQYAWCELRAINNSGWVIGKGRRPGNIFHDGKTSDIVSFVIHDGVTTELPGSVYAINNRGQIVGNLQFEDGSYHAVRWDPVSEPASLIVLLTGIGGTAASLLRRKVR